MFSERLDQLVKEFCNFVANRYHLNEDEIYQLWKSSTPSTPSTSSTSTSSVVSSQPSSSKPDPDSEITREKVMTGTKDMLSAMCKKVGLKQSGKKEELSARLLDYLSSSSSSSSTSTSSATKAASSKSSKKEDAPIVKAVKERQVELAIRKNNFGNFEHVQTGLIFGTDKIVCGRQLADGKIADLTVDDIELCKKYKFPYKVPENLNTSKNVDDVKIDEIEEEELDEEDLEEEVEEEEEEEEEEEN